MFDALKLITADAILAARTDRTNEALLGAAFFPARKKIGIDLEWLKTHKGLNVELMPSALDALPVIRQRGTVDVQQQQMMFYRETMQIKEKDMIALAQIESINAPVARQIYENIYDDANELIDGAEIAAEAARIQLLYQPAIYVAGDNINVMFDYDPAGTWALNNTDSVTTAWSDTDNSTPLSDLNDLINKARLAGREPKYIVMSPATFTDLKKNAEVIGAIISVASGVIRFADDDTVREVIRRVLGVEVIVYAKRYRAAAGQEKAFFPDGVVSLICYETLGNTWYGSTPEERTTFMNKNVDISLYDNRIAVCVDKKFGPPSQVVTSASQMLLPSYENMDGVFVLNVVGDDTDSE